MSTGGRRDTDSSSDVLPRPPFNMRLPSVHDTVSDCSEQKPKVCCHRACCHIESLILFLIASAACFLHDRSETARSITSVHTAIHGVLGPSSMSIEPKTCHLPRHIFSSFAVSPEFLARVEFHLTSNSHSPVLATQPRR